MMKGLLIKDILVLRQQALIYGILLAVWCGFSIAGQNPTFFTGAMGVLSMLIILNCYAYDEKANWDKLALTTPVSRAYMVLSKYLLTFLLILFSFAVSILVCCVVGGDIGEGVFSSLSVLSIVLCWVAICLPLLTKFGVEKARMLIILIMLIPTFLLMLLPQTNLISIDASAVETLLKIAPLVAILLYGASAFLSVRIYSKKEF